MHRMPGRAASGGNLAPVPAARHRSRTDGPTDRVSCNRVCCLSILRGEGKGWKKTGTAGGADFRDTVGV